MSAQSRVAAWIRITLGENEARNVPERVLRAVEEVVELAQACGSDADTLHRLVDYVFARPAGEPAQEIAGSFVTLYTVAAALGIDADAAFEAELKRIHDPYVVDKVRRRQAEKREALRTR